MSERLSHRDLAGVLAGVRELHGFEAGTNLPRRMIKITRELVPCEAVTYGKLTDDGSAETRQYRFLQQPLMEKFGTHLPALVANIHEHPLFSPLMEQSERPHKISDFVAPRQFSKSRLYREFYRHLGLRHQMIGVLPRLPEARVFLMLNRCGRDFSERDRRRVISTTPTLPSLVSRKSAAKFGPQIFLRSEGLVVQAKCIGPSLRSG